MWLVCSELCSGTLCGSSVLRVIRHCGMQGINFYVSKPFREQCSANETTVLNMVKKVAKKRGRAIKVEPTEDLGNAVAEDVPEPEKIAKTVEKIQSESTDNGIVKKVGKKRGRAVKVEPTEDLGNAVAEDVPKPEKIAKTVEKIQPESTDFGDESTIYQFTVKNADGQDVCLSKYKGHPVLIVNVASNCGYTKKNYTQLKELLDLYQDQGLRMAAFPCNQFGGQEPWDACLVRNKMKEKYGIKPDFYAKVSVNGKEADPLYAFLRNKQGNGAPVRWNFNKFLVDKHGIVVKRYLSGKQPMDLAGDIETLIADGELPTE